MIFTNVNNAGKSAYKVSASYSLGYATDEEDVNQIAALVFTGGGVWLNAATDSKDVMIIDLGFLL